MFRLIKSLFLEIYTPLYRSSGNKWISFAIGYLSIGACLALNVFTLCGLLEEFLTIHFTQYMMVKNYAYMIIAAIMILELLCLTPIKRTLRERKHPLKLKPIRLVVYVVFTLGLFVFAMQLALNPSH